MDRICVIGLGYIGLPTSVMFANNGKKVHGVDVNESVVVKTKNKQVHIEENGLEERLIAAIDNGNLTVSTSPVKADVFIIAVPSPINLDKTANLEYVRSATESIVPFLEKGNLVILESTVPPRTVEDLMLPILEKGGLEIGTELFISHSPERVIPGRVFEELVNNSRIVGGINEESSKRTSELYKSFVKGEIFITNATTAEMVKVIENTYRDVNIAFANELAKVSENIGVNVWEAISLANHHPRVNIHSPGPGVGGHCIAVDPWFLVELDPENSRLIHLARKTNDAMPEYTVKRLQSIISRHQIHNPRVAVLGLAFKANIDDMRESPSIEVIEQIKMVNIDYIAYDPHINEEKIEKQTLISGEAVKNADVLLILTEHDEFKFMDPEKLASIVRSRIVLDTKNCLNKSVWEKAGFEVNVLGDSAKG